MEKLNLEDKRYNKSIEGLGLLIRDIVAAYNNAVDTINELDTSLNMLKDKTN